MSSAMWSAIALLAVSGSVRAQGDDDGLATIVVHLEGDNAQLQGPKGQTLCVSPCDARVPRNAKYRVTLGRASVGSHSSRPFMLDEKAESDAVRVTVWHEARSRWPIALAVGGASALGAVAMASVPLLSNGSCGGLVCPNPDLFYALAGVIGFVGTLVSTILLFDPKVTVHVAVSRWTPALAAGNHGASLGFRGSF